MKQAARNHLEGGQIIVIFALAVVGLFSFTALAVDLGKVFTDRRYYQNVADSAALAGGQNVMTNIKWLRPQDFNCNTSDWVTNITDPAWVNKPAWLDNTKLNAIVVAAVTNASGNHKTDLSYGLHTQNGVAISCKSDAVSAYLDVKVMVSGITDTMFTQFFSRGGIRNSVEAVARIYPRTAALSGYGIYALDPDCEEGILINGGGNQPINVQIDAGGAFSRSCINSTGHGSMRSATSISCLYNADHPNWCDPNDTNFTPRLNTVTRDPLKGLLQVPDCSNRTIAPAQTISGSVLSPGYYAGGLPGHSALQLQPGLYCIAGDIRLNGGGSLTSISAGGKTGVTIVFMDGGFSVTGNGYMEISAASPDPLATTVAPYVVPGAAIMYAPGNSSDLDLGGNSLSKITGTVYTPESEITLGGTGDVPTSTQFIAFKFKYHGTEMEHLVYNGEVVAQLPATLSLYK
jgi:hypothetical protein